jgi:subtilase family serine protease
VVAALVPAVSSWATPAQFGAAGRPLVSLAPHGLAQAPPTFQQCKHAGVTCYAPAQLQAAYDMGPLYAQGLTGAGTTIALVDSFGTPNAQAVLHTFDVEMGLPDPPSFQVVQPAGPVTVDPNDPTQFGWAVEASLDIEYAHAMAPGAGILLVETPVAETEGVAGLPEMIQSENYVIDNNLAQVVSQSFSADEPTFGGIGQILPLRSAFQNARAHGVSMLAATGDFGATNPLADGSCCFAFRNIGFPASDPLVTAVGGTEPFLHADGSRTKPDRAAFFSGGGTSMFFATPSWQAGLFPQAGRGIPDISMAAFAPHGGTLVWIGADSNVASNGWYLVNGTSESSPLFAGVVAIADQLKGHPLGDINPLLYQLGGMPHNGIVDVTTGNNSLRFTDASGNHITVRGFPAVPGYDLSTGLGTVDGAQFVPALAGTN